MTPAERRDTPPVVQDDASETSLDPKARRKDFRRSLAQDAVNLPNLLTFARIVMIPVCLWFLDQDTPKAGFWSAIMFTLAAITDLLDGYLARKLGVVSVLGKLIDPLADKLIVMASLVWMVPMGRMPAWAVIVLLAREFSVTALRSVAASEGVIISAGQEGKTKTALQMIGIIALLVGYPYHLSYAGIDLGLVDCTHVGRALVYLSLVFSVASAAQYVGLFAQAVEAKDEKRGGTDKGAGLS
ncbi:MAG: CDP-diacylglycerol--glycerol-3-phosphate 3-phosphatidyltransferase [Labilithrix sp.]|nr:CDP-diacylglycerol--glycerol-3-phosphate 3-phosphatidyltransferase [Labilithrix sp.]